MYEVSVGRSVQKEIRDLHPSVMARVIAALRTLGADPRPPGCKKLVGSKDLWRIRVSDYRIVYSIDDGEKIVTILIVRHRSKAYE